MAYRDVSVWLEDILISIERIKKHIEGITSYSVFTKNQLVIDATERNLEIIAEALKNAVRLQPDLPVSETKKIISLRNIINHVYYEIEYDRIWIIITKDLLVLESEVKKILEDYERKLELKEL
jgi:uncharacterized protein with HEPN domain